ncbi:hypothetical protein WME94_01450 [Sorangium sp. So ce429]
MKMLDIAPYTEQAARWPAAGRHILAQGVEDISAFVAEQREVMRRDLGALESPLEDVYRPEDVEVASRVGIASRAMP